MLCFIAQLCPTLFDPMDCSPPGSSVHGDSPGKNTRVSCHALLEGIFPSQGSNPGLLHCRQILYRLSHQGSLNNSIVKSSNLLRLNSSLVDYLELEGIFPFIHPVDIFLKDSFWKIILFIYLFRLCWAFIAAWAFSSCSEQGLLSGCSEQGLLSSCNVWASHCGGFSCCGAWAVRHAGFSRCGSQALEHRLNSCGTQV